MKKGSLRRLFVGYLRWSLEPSSSNFIPPQFIFAQFIFAQFILD